MIGRIDGGCREGGQRTHHRVAENVEKRSGVYHQATKTRRRKAKGRKSIFQGALPLRPRPFNLPALGERGKGMHRDLQIMDKQSFTRGSFSMKIRTRKQDSDG